MKKLMAIVLTGVLAVSVLAACGNTDKDNAEPTKAVSYTHLTLPTKA